MTIPADKKKDFGLHLNRYYQLQTEIFYSSMDNQLLQILWHKYWVNTITKSSLFINQKYFT